MGRSAIDGGTVIAVRPRHPASGQNQDPPSFSSLGRIVVVSRQLWIRRLPRHAASAEWVLLQMDADEEQTTGFGARSGRLHQKRLADGRMDWGTVVALPWGSRSGYSAWLWGRRDPHHRGAGATRWRTSTASIAVPLMTTYASGGWWSDLHRAGRSHADSP